MYLLGIQSFFRVGEHVEVHGKGDVVVDFHAPHGAQVELEAFQVDDEGRGEFSKGAAAEGVDLRGGGEGEREGVRG